MKLLVSLLAATKSDSTVSTDQTLPKLLDIDEIATCGADLSIAEIEV